MSDNDPVLFSKVKLNSQQQKVVESGLGFRLIIAGAGAGKTKTLVETAAYLVEKCEIKPEELLILTFTRLAINEFKERLHAKFNLSPEDVVSREITDSVAPTINTFHGFCLQLLKWIKYKPNPDSHFEIRIISDRNSKVLLVSSYFRLSGYYRNLIFGHLCSSHRKEQSSEDDAHEYLSFRLADALWHDFEEFRLDARSNENHRISSEKYFFDNDPKEKEDNGSIRSAFLQLWTFYEEELKKLNSVDYSSLEHLADEHVFKVPERLEILKNKFKVIMLDELQDTSEKEWEMLNKLNPVAGYYVGDPDQRIYEFRNADRYIFEKVARKCNSTPHQLTINYRSSPNIISVSKIYASKLNVSEDDRWLHKNTIPNPDYSGFNLKIKVFKKDKDQFLELVVNKANEYLERNKQLEGEEQKKLAILVRSNFRLEQVRNTLGASGIDYEYANPSDFFSREWIEYVLCFLKIIFLDELSIFTLFPLKWIHTSLLPWCGQKTIKDVLAKIKSQQESPKKVIVRIFQDKEYFFEVVKDVYGFKTKKTDKKDAFSRFIDLIVQFKRYENCRLDQLDELIKRILSDTGLLRDRFVENQSLIKSDIEKLIRMFLGYSNGNENVPVRDLINTLDKFEYVFYEHIDKNNSGIFIGTIHSSKGLEFDGVCLGFVNESEFPSRRAKYEEDERRLIYVATSRAKEELIISYESASPFIYELRGADEVEFFE
ncbi:ATP-dependent helicase [Candidatus Mycoplasma haematohominis]|uniref:ATP-dependent helicase n=1 Tax=Candidatus Mycoplasma haematohominis TaxID=1494318 RepID=UPI001C0A75B9|nr:ATP-dependent helicase [Candidatus Mycoplasma haemohominis]